MNFYQPTEKPTDNKLNPPIGGSNVGKPKKDKKKKK